MPQTAYGCVQLRVFLALDAVVAGPMTTLWVEHEV
jgi:hypothetical protein